MGDKREAAYHNPLSEPPVRKSMPPVVQHTSDRHLTRRGQVVEVVFYKGQTSHYENITIGQARALCEQLAEYLGWNLE